MSALSLTHDAGFTAVAITFTFLFRHFLLCFFNIFSFEVNSHTILFLVKAVLHPSFFFLCIEIPFVVQMSGKTQNSNTTPSWLAPAHTAS